MYFHYILPYSVGRTVLLENQLQHRLLYQQRVMTHCLNIFLLPCFLSCLTLHLSFPSPLCSLPLALLASHFFTSLPSPLHLSPLSFFPHFRSSDSGWVYDNRDLCSGRRYSLICYGGCGCTGKYSVYIHRNSFYFRRNSSR